MYLYDIASKKPSFSTSVLLVSSYLQGQISISSVQGYEAKFAILQNIFQDIQLKFRMTSPLRSLRKSRPLYAAFVILSISCGILYGHGFIVSILSIVLFTLFFKQDPDLVENTVQDGTAISNDQEVLKVQPGNDPIVITHDKEEVREVNEMDQLQGNLANKSADLYSETESTDELTTSDESDIEWPCYGRSQDFSDGSISDEESLIEIALTGEQYILSPKDEDNKVCSQHKVPTLLPDDTLGQHGLKELFAEFNEEDNLIEIDIAMGSIKCSRFIIEA